MAANTGRPDPTAPSTPVDTVAAARDEVLSQSTVDALLNLTAEDIIGEESDAEVVKGGAYRPGGWLHAPARLELFASADRRLTRVANQRGISVKRVERVIPRLVKGTKLLVLQATRAEDLTGIPVNRHSGAPSVFINLIGILGEAGLTVETGYRERYDVAYVPQGSLLAPGLLIDLSKPVERRAEGQSKRGKSRDKAQPASSGGTASVPAGGTSTIGTGTSTARTTTPGAAATGAAATGAAATGAATTGAATTGAATTGAAIAGPNSSATAIAPTGTSTPAVAGDSPTQSAAGTPATAPSRTD